MSKRIKVLDVTLRDGGCVNNFNFGQEYMKQILGALELSEVNYIEVGYIDQKDGSECGRTKFINEKVIEESFLWKKKKDVKYVAMIDYGKYDISLLSPYDGKGIDGIRLAFHKEDYCNIIEYGKKVIENGYELFIQPMIITRYTDAELLELIQLVNEQLPNATCFYIVDSFGEMRANDLIRILNLVDHNLVKSMGLGFHSHNNLQLSYSNAMAFMSFSTKREVVIDSSIMGMGKGAGNLNTELLLEHLNLSTTSAYNIEPLMKVIDRVINVIHKEFYWGYAIEYYLSAINHCSPSYAAHFFGKHMLPISEVANILTLLEPDKKISFDREYAEKIYLQYNEQKKLDDAYCLEMLKKEFESKKVLIIAPGKSILQYDEKIKELIGKKDVLSISLNNFKYVTDYTFITRKDLFEVALSESKRVIVPANVANETFENVYIIDYEKWICKEDSVQDGSGVMILNIMREVQVSEVILAGFDGFSADVNKNYFDKCMRITFSNEQADVRNNFLRHFIEELRESINITFLTPSLYDIQN